MYILHPQANILRHIGNQFVPFLNTIRVGSLWFNELEKSSQEEQYMTAAKLAGKWVEAGGMEALQSLLARRVVASS
jgi:hypothetical protein